MSIQITTAFVEQYKGNVEHLVQQKGSRLRDKVSVETVVGKNAYFEQIGSTAARVRTTRHQDTPRMDTPHSRRRVSLVDYDWADLIDDEDRVRMLIDPAGPYSIAASAAMGRAMDEAIIDAADGTAYTGVAGGTSTSYDSNNTVDVQVGISPAADTGLNVGKLRAAKQILDANEADDDNRTMVINAKQLQNLLAETEVTSSDYASVKALVQGEVNTFLGFNFVRTELIETDSNSDHKVLFWQNAGMKLAIGKDSAVKISERDDKNYATQVFVSMSIGATRMQEELVGYIECHPS
jgi:hypothetical protein|tara:strand:- start:5377 stop:6258 length:882 start_codon:yes stop_codon:yes gene_type:complete